MDNLGLVTPPIRTDHPVTELTDRYARVRLHAWQLLEAPDYSITTLRDLAVLGVATHAHTAALHGADLTRPDATNRQLKPLLDRARAWQDLHHTLTGLVTAGPGDVVVREDLIAITRTLQTLAPVPDDNRRAVTATYQALRTHPFQPNPPAHAPDAGISRAADVNVIARAGYGW